jgi:hypothetical protein
MIPSAAWTWQGSMEKIKGIINTTEKIRNFFITFSPYMFIVENRVSLF